MVVGLAGVMGVAEVAGVDGGGVLVGAAGSGGLVVEGAEVVVAAGVGRAGALRAKLATNWI